jgi:CRP-like cAMP-binding protein
LILSAASSTTFGQQRPRGFGSRLATRDAPPPTARRMNTKNRLLATLPRQDQEELWPDLHPVSLVLGQTLYEVGQPIEHVYFIERGVASIVTLMADGSTSEVGMIGPEGLVGLAGLLGAEASAQHIVVQIPGTALRMNAAACKAAFDQRPTFRAIVHRFINSFLNLSAQTAACNRLHSVEQRCARWLLMAADRAGAETIPVTHEFLGSMLGARRTGVTAIARKLRRAGLIDYRHGRITIVDRNGLEAVACECYGFDHARLSGSLSSNLLG